MESRGNMKKEHQDIMCKPTARNRLMQSKEDVHLSPTFEKPVSVTLFGAIGL